LPLVRVVPLAEIATLEPQILRFGRKRKNTSEYGRHEAKHEQRDRKQYKRDSDSIIPTRKQPKYRQNAKAEADPWECSGGPCIQVNQEALKGRHGLGPDS